ncbi:hypothetical protein ACNTMW_09875 [Planosporangium sp. 12N6]
MTRRRTRVTPRTRRRIRVDEDLLVQALVLIAEEITRQRTHPDNT